MKVNLMYESVKVFLVAGAKVNKGLDGLVGVCRYILSLSPLDYADHVVGEGGPVGDTVVDVGRFVDTNKRFIEYCEKIAKELESYGLTAW